MFKLKPYKLSMGKSVIYETKNVIYLASVYLGMAFTYVE